FFWGVVFFFLWCLAVVLVFVFLFFFCVFLLWGPRTLGVRGPCRCRAVVVPLFAPLDLVVGSCR
ncbi:hypothetical protein, partial [Streptomyces cinerochromogenes]|uniref:hypothetical protein n=1 Tax=Streptomyces cinerochromogenes TaxID=66422 RepID=UPI0033AD6A37